MQLVIDQEVTIDAKQAQLKGNLVVPQGAQGIVVFAHGSGSGRFSPRNRYVAEELQQGGLATLLVDLLEESESDDRRKVFDIDLLTTRLLSATDWIARNKLTNNFNIGYFGASTGAAAALEAASIRGSQIGAVVSRGGRPDLAAHYLSEVSAPTLLIVGGEDYQVISLNEDAYAALRCEKELQIIPGATHLFEEPGTLEEVAKSAKAWFTNYLANQTTTEEGEE